jgi:hypothetical protein
MGFLTGFNQEHMIIESNNNLKLFIESSKHVPITTKTITTTLVWTIKF